MTSVFTKGNKYASQGGKARAAALTPEKRHDIASQGGKANIQALADKHFGGDYARASKYMRDWLAYWNDPYSDSYLGKWPYPGGPLPNKKKLSKSLKTSE